MCVFLNYRIITYSYITLKITHYKKNYNGFSKFIELCNYHHKPVFEYFYPDVLLFMQ